MKAQIKVTLKQGVLDPQGKAIESALGALGFSGVEHVRQGKLIEIGVDGMLISWVDYRTECKQWIDEVMPLMEQAGQRKAFARAA